MSLLLLTILFKFVLEALGLLGRCLYEQHKVNDAVKFTEQCLSIVRDITPQHEKFLSHGKCDFCFIHCYEFISLTQRFQPLLTVYRKFR